MYPANAKVGPVPRVALRPRQGQQCVPDCPAAPRCNLECKPGASCAIAVSKFSEKDPSCVVECPKAYCRDEVSGRAIPPASDTQPPPKGSPGPLSSPVLAGVVVGAVLLVVLSSILVSGILISRWCRRRRRRRPLLDGPGRGSVHRVSGKPELEGSPGYGSTPGAVAGALALKPELMEVERPLELGEEDNNRNLPNSGSVYELERAEGVIHRTQGHAIMDTSSRMSSRSSRARSERSSQRRLRFSFHSQERNVGRNGSQRSRERLLRIQEIEEVTRRLTEELQRLNKGRSGTRPESS
ncbi:hypothetical protein MAPG_01912 [Magnaporthiopsis poae ATCC 64411]|uniref:Uncharacterized protein n=1 Tax=Magnaporthiopsis poae (strain ATCC 64411 / 73-15) TaxID=644358 RepID=A0A0C4DPY1_MAGP6|nr:hypothetical protein MAPG_01912 [Magnaporthiopsis poae ATCC 64411]